MNWESQFISPCNIRKYKLFVSWEFISRGSPVLSRWSRKQALLLPASLSCVQCLIHCRAYTTAIYDINQPQHVEQLTNVSRLLTPRLQFPCRCDNAPLSDPFTNPLKCELFLALCSSSLMWSDYKDACHICALCLTFFAYGQSSFLRSLFLNVTSPFIQVLPEVTSNPE
jgi:hypothetical protein